MTTFSHSNTSQNKSSGGIKFTALSKRRIRKKRIKQRKQQNRKPCAPIIPSLKVSLLVNSKSKGAALNEMKQLEHWALPHLCQGTILTIVIGTSEVPHRPFTLRKGLSFPKIQSNKMLCGKGNLRGKLNNKWRGVE